MIDEHYENRMEVLTQNAISDALPIYHPLIDELKKVIRSAGGLSAAKKAIEALHHNSEFVKSLSKHLLDSLESSEALGRSLIIKKDDAAGSGEAVSAKDSSLEWIALDDGPVNISFDVVPQAALELLKNQSLTLSGVENQEILDAVRDKIADAIEKKMTFAEFETDVDSIFNAFGVTPLSPRHVELVFRMNVFSAYNNGMAQQISAMPGRFPLAFFSPIMDARSRHIPLRGYYPADIIPIPPVDYNFRCSIRYIHVSQITGHEAPMYNEIPRPDLVKFDQRED
jgi:hypothetical protein